MLSNISNFFKKGNTLFIDSFLNLKISYDILLIEQMVLPGKCGKQIGGGLLCVVRNFGVRARVEAKRSDRKLLH